MNLKYTEHRHFRRDSIVTTLFVKLNKSSFLLRPEAFNINRNVKKSREKRIKNDLIK